MKFKTEKIDGGVRFTAEDGWVDLLIDGSRANLWCGTFNGTDPTVFGNRLWHLLKDVMPNAELRVVAYEGDVDPFVEQILLAAGFSKDGCRRAWGTDGQDVVLYSILATEVRYEVTDVEQSIDGDAPGTGATRSVLPLPLGGTGDNAQ